MNGELAILRMLTFTIRQTLSTASRMHCAHFYDSDYRPFDRDGTFSISRFPKAPTNPPSVPMEPHFATGSTNGGRIRAVSGLVYSHRHNRSVIPSPTKNLL